VDPTSRTVSVRAVVANRGGRLRPQMLATVHLDRGQPRTGAAIPDSAIQLMAGKSVVFTVMPMDKGDVMFMKREIKLEAKTRDGRQIVSGIDKGDVIVIEGAFAVKARLEQSKLKMGPM
jgi:multidrug efflux pump subunit AcrA (membrane-fusion protein)